VNKAERSIARLYDKAPAAVPGFPYKAVTTKQIKGWQQRYFGSVSSMTNYKAQKAAAILDNYAPGTAMGTRFAIFEICDQLHTKANADRAMTRLVDKAPQLNQRVPYKAVGVDKVDQWLARHFGPVTEMSAPKARIAKSILDSFAPGVALGTRTYMFELEKQLASQAAKK